MIYNHIKENLKHEQEFSGECNTNYKLTMSKTVLTEKSKRKECLLKFNFFLIGDP